MSFKTLIVSSFCQERADLRKVLNKIDMIEIIGETVSGKEAFKLTQAIPYDLLFVDIDLEDMSGLDLIKSLTNTGFSALVIFLANDERYAAEAFTSDAVDYLIKPIEEKRLLNAIDRAVRWGRVLKKKEAHTEKISIPAQAFNENDLFEALEKSWQKNKRVMPSIQKLPVEKGTRRILVPYSKIIFAEAWGDYTYVYTTEQKLFTSFSLKTLEDRFQGTSFFRVHRKYLVNLDQVVEIASLPGGAFYLRTMGKHKIEIPISRRRLKQLKEILGL
jgi:DNA-binding LytR/AlgR family response regulator